MIETNNITKSIVGKQRRKSPMFQKKSSQEE